MAEYIQLKSVLGTNVYPVLSTTPTVNDELEKRPLVLGSKGQALQMSTTIGSNTQPVYVSNGTITASTGTFVKASTVSVGNTNTPIYLSSGVLTAGASAIHQITLSTATGIVLTGTSAVTEAYYTATIGLSTVFSAAQTNIGPESAVTGSAGSTATFTVPYLSVDVYGRVTSISGTEVKIPVTQNTDKKVEHTSTSANTALPLLFGTVASPGTGNVGYNANFTYNPNTKALSLSGGTITASTFSGDLSGKATSASSADKVEHKLIVKGSNANGIEFDGSSADKTINIVGSNDISISASVSGNTSTITVSGAALSSRIDGIMASNQAMRFRMVISTTTADIGTAQLKTINGKDYEVGDTFIVGTSTVKTVLGNNVEPGDMVLIIGTTRTNSDAYIIQANVDGAVTAGSTLTANKLVIGSDDKTVKASDIYISSVAYSDAALGSTYLLVGKNSNAKIGTSSVKATEVVTTSSNFAAAGRLVITAGTGKTIKADEAALTVGSVIRTSSSLVNGNIVVATNTNTIEDTGIKLSSTIRTSDSLVNGNLVKATDSHTVVNTGIVADNVITKAGSLADGYLVVGSSAKTVNDSKLKLSSTVRVGNTQLTSGNIAYAIDTNSVATVAITTSALYNAVNYYKEVTQTISDTDTSTYNILFQSAASGAATTTDTTRFSQRLKFNPNTSKLEIGTSGTGNTSEILLYNGDVKVKRDNEAAMSAVFFTAV